VLTDEAKAAFEGWTEKLASTDLVFRRADGEAWGKSHQKRTFCATPTARISP
jgi:hypothetical protein